MKKKTSPVSLLLALCLLAPALAQQPQRPPATTQPAPSASRQQPAPQDTQDDIVRISTNLVQIDAVVVDRQGRQVTDLTAEDFEIFEEGKPQEITNFSYVPVGAAPSGAPRSGAASASAPPASPRPARRGDAPVVAPAPPRRAQLRRTFAIIVDNLRMSHGSIGSVRAGLRKFVDEQVQPGDLVGIFRTRGGSGTLQQFTTDKAQLHKAIDAVRWYPRPLGGTGIDVYETARDDSTYKPVRAGSGSAPAGKQTFEDERTREAREAGEDRVNDINATGTLGALRMVMQSMATAPGRKAVILFGDGLRIYNRKGDTAYAVEAMTRAIDAANRTGVVVYTANAQGITVPGMISAADEVRPNIDTGNMGEGSGDPTETLRAARVEDAIRSEDGFVALADGTGGRYIKNVNNLDVALEQVMREQAGYYLLGYRPTDETFKGGRMNFRDISVKVRRPGLRVSYRKGFLAFANEERRRPTRGSDAELLSLLASPITAGDVYVRMTAGVVGAPAAGGGASTRLLLHIDARDVTFTPEAGGTTAKLVLDVAAVTLDKNGEVVDEFNRTHTVRTGGDTLERIRQNGLTYTADVPVKKSGSYQLRIVVRDQATQKVGSASQFIEVPDLSKGSLTLSAISLRDGAQQGPAAVGGAAPATAATALAPVMSPADPAVRRFRPGAVLSYGYQVYNATLDPATGRPRLSAQLRLFHNGELAAEGQPIALDTAGQTEAARPRFEELMRVVENAKPGEYVLQVVVTDALAKGGAQTSQWIDFEVVR